MSWALGAAVLLKHGEEIKAITKDSISELLAGARRIDWRSEAGRDLVTFTRYPETVEDLVRDAVRLAGLPVDEETVKRTLGQLFELSGETVLNLAKARPDVARVDANVAKGVIGVLAAVRWYTTTYPGALIISLDDAKNHRWVLGHQPDDRHGDLVAVRPSDNGVIVEGIEVKAHNDEEAGTREVSGVIEGKAVIQVEQTLRVLRDLMNPAVTSPVSKARAAVLRDQLYRAVAARPPGHRLADSSSGSWPMVARNWPSMCQDLRRRCASAT